MVKRLALVGWTVLCGCWPASFQSGALECGPSPNVCPSGMSCTCGHCWTVGAGPQQCETTAASATGASSSGASVSASSTGSVSSGTASSATAVGTSGSTSGGAASTGAGGATGTTSSGGLAWLPVDAGITPNCPPEVSAAQGPLVINDANWDGGVFTGNWASTDAGVPVVSIQTSQPVTLQGCTVSGPGNLIEVDVQDAQLSVESCRGFGVTPGVAGQVLGSFVEVGSSASVSRLTVEHCDIENLSHGIYLNGPAANVTLRYNFAKNFNGQLSDGDGGFQLSPTAQGALACFLLLQDVEAISDAEIAWNFVLDQPGQSALSFGIFIQQSSGTSVSPVLIHDNFIYGGYYPIPTDPNYFGSGISTNGLPGETLAQACGYLRIYDNQVLNNAGSGIVLDDGHDTQAYGNHTVSTGFLPGEWPDGGVMASVIASGNYIQDPNDPATIFFNDAIYDGLSGWERSANDAGDLLRIDYALDECADGGCVDNQSLPTGPITNASEAAEGGLWLWKLADAGVTIGPVCP